jgi:hypothetical protein
VRTEHKQQIELHILKKKMARKMELHCIWTVHAYIELNSTTLQQKKLELAKFELKSAATTT